MIKKIIIFLSFLIPFIAFIGGIIDALWLLILGLWWLVLLCVIVIFPLFLIIGLSLKLLSFALYLKPEDIKLKFPFVRFYIFIFLFNFLITHSVNSTFKTIMRPYLINSYPLLSIILISYSVSIIPMIILLKYLNQKMENEGPFLEAHIFAQSFLYAGSYGLFLILGIVFKLPKDLFSLIYITSLIVITYLQTNKIKDDLIKLFNQDE